MTIKIISPSILILGIVISTLGIYFYFNGFIPKEGTMNTPNRPFDDDISPRPDLVSNAPPLTVQQMLIADAKYIDGVIESFGGETIIIKPFTEGSVFSTNAENTTMQVIVNEQTIYQAQVLKNPATFQKELQDFQNMPVGKQDMMIPPLPYVLEKVSREMLIPGKEVTVESADPITPLTTMVTAKSVKLFLDILAQ